MTYAPNEYLIWVVLVALIVAIVVLFILRAQLKTAKFQKTAKEYIVDGSMHLHCKNDIYLYQTVTRSKIEKEQESHDDNDVDDDN